MKLPLGMISLCEHIFRVSLGRIWDPNVPDDKSLYRALFVSPGGNIRVSDEMYFMQPSPVFTSTVKTNPNPLEARATKTNDRNYINRPSYQYAMMGVDIDDGVSESEIAQGAESIIALRTNSWAMGICFTKDIPAREFVFPWPEELRKVVPNPNGQEDGQS